MWAHAGWVGNFYPPKTPARMQLTEYGRRLTAVEGNACFYALPTEEVLARWRKALPDGFAFCPKMVRAVTHEGPLAPRIDVMRAAVARLALLGARLGPIFVQLPETYGPENEHDLVRFLDAWPHDTARVLVELRHQGWYAEPLRARLAYAFAERRVGRVVLDTRPVYQGPGNAQMVSVNKKPAVPVVAQATADVCMLRFIGHPQLDVNTPFLEQWAARIDRWLRDGRDVHAFAHCPNEDRSPAIALELQQLLEREGAPVPRLPWCEIPAPHEQGDLFGQ